MNSGSVRGQPKPARDENALDLGGAFTDLEDFGIPVEPGHGVFLHEAVAAENLGGDARRGHGRFARVELADRGGLLDLGHRLVSLVLFVLEPGRPIGQLPGGFHHHGQIGDLERHALVDADRTPEGDSGLGVCRGLLQHALTHRFHELRVRGERHRLVHRADFAHLRDFRAEAVARQHLVVKVAHVRDIPGDAAGRAELCLLDVRLNDRRDAGNGFDGTRRPASLQAPTGPASSTTSRPIRVSRRTSTPTARK